MGQFQNCRGGFFSGSLVYLLHLSLGREDSGWPEAPHSRSSTLQAMSGNPLLGLMRDDDKGLKVIETERSPVETHAGLILERPRESR